MKEPNKCPIKAEISEKKKLFANSQEQARLAPEKIPIQSNKNAIRNVYRNWIKKNLEWTFLSCFLAFAAQPTPKKRTRKNFSAQHDGERRSSTLTARAPTRCRAVCGVEVCLLLAVLFQLEMREEIYKFSDLFGDFCFTRQYIVRLTRFETSFQPRHMIEEKKLRSFKRPSLWLRSPPLFVLTKPISPQNCQ